MFTRLVTLALITALGSPGDQFVAEYRTQLGTPYATGTLSSSEEEERLVHSVDRVDCVTSIETALAGYRAQNADEFLDRLQSIRYKDGILSWESRNHYMTDWLRENEEYVRDITRDLPHAISRTKQLCYLQDQNIPCKKVTFWYVPKREFESNFDEVASQLKNGDILLFTSTHPELDIGHAGIYRQADLLLHASIRKGNVTEERFKEYLLSSSFDGIIVGRPTGL